MLIDQQIKHFKALNIWFQSPLGLSVVREFNNQLDLVKECLRGDALLQLGSCSTNPWLDSLSYHSKWLASPFEPHEGISLECSFSQIPLTRNSVDCVLAPMVLEPFDNSFSLIDEIDRILKPMGLIVLFSINPWSLWGAAMKLGLLNCYDHRKISLRTAFHLNRIFLQRGYRQCSLTNFGYIPPVNKKSLITKLTFFDEVGKMIWPYPSGFYCFIAQKYEHIGPSLLAQPVTHLDVKPYKSPLQPATN
ncbi:methyltransferase domain-containing protein [Legionella worsleiensis]|uniref:Methyl-transferase n=1 Tax=Legionella worsleiensis TaxID=45076 RepID=A0A0W1AJ23_9GAMM|nr:methyltransferase domain-containing protein [Legionella worsleiensis]KTD81370.1 methyl-transferase [Legionella worsleiensis]STY29983.1 methyl-transferase [Legionella worsleiensis]